MAVRIRNVSFAYDGLTVLKNIHLHVQPGRFTVLLGKNGSGKSTLFKLIAGFLKNQQGEISVMGHDLRSLTNARRARLIGILFQRHHGMFPFSAQDVVLTGRASYVTLTPKIEDRQAAAEALEKVGISHLALRPYTELSGGEQQLVMIARVLAQHPKIILLDEPTAHLDFVNSHRLLRIVKGLAESGYTVVAVLHDPNQAFLYGDEFIFLKNGELFTPDKGQPPWDPAVIKEVYDADVDCLVHENLPVILPKRRK
jgi:iron complex transport system ATP-binding protein